MTATNAPLATETLLKLAEPHRAAVVFAWRIPPATIVLPLYELAADSTSIPVPVLISGMPEKPGKSWMAPDMARFALVLMVKV